MSEYVLPEFTRSLRSLGLPASQGSGHDRIFGPLIQARAAAQRMHTPEAQISAFDASRLERSWREAIAELSRERHPRSAPERRALEAELDSLAGPVWEALQGLQAAAQTARIAPLQSRDSAWNSWVASVGEVFNAADTWWGRAREVLGRQAPRSASFIRRIFSRSTRV